MRTSLNTYHLTTDEEIGHDLATASGHVQSALGKIYRRIREGDVAACEAQGTTRSLRDTTNSPTTDHNFTPR